VEESEVEETRRLVSGDLGPYWSTHRNHCRSPRNNDVLVPIEENLTLSLVRREIAGDTQVRGCLLAVFN
jgi:hypothetical protein